MEPDGGRSAGRNSLLRGSPYWQSGGMVASEQLFRSSRMAFVCLALLDGADRGAIRCGSLPDRSRRSRGSIHDRRRAVYRNPAGGGIVCGLRRVGPGDGDRLGESRRVRVGDGPTGCGAHRVRRQRAAHRRLEPGEDPGPGGPGPRADGRVERQDDGQAPGEAADRAQDRDRRDPGDAGELQGSRDRQADPSDPRRELQRVEPLGGQDEEVEGDRHPQGDDARVLGVAPRRDAQGGGRAGERRGDLARAPEGRRARPADRAGPERGGRRGRRHRAGPARLPMPWSSRWRRRPPRGSRS